MLFCRESAHYTRENETKFASIPVFLWGSRNKKSPGSVEPEDSFQTVRATRFELATPSTPCWCSSQAELRPDCRERQYSTGMGKWQSGENIKGCTGRGSCPCSLAEEETKYQQHDLLGKPGCLGIDTSNAMPRGKAPGKGWKGGKCAQTKGSQMTGCLRIVLRGWVGFIAFQPGREPEPGWPGQPRW